ncbi:MAG: hypothetical protein Q7J84_02275, partial [Sulfuricaulis sp.]|nr:hypothetical protein [Sulfuricaulis sp.]
DEAAGAQSVREIKSLMKVDNPVSIRAHAFAHFLALLRHHTDLLARIVNVAGVASPGREPKCPEAGLDRRPGTILKSLF